MSFVLAGAIVIAVPSLCYFGRRGSLECHAASILFAASLTSAGAIPSNAALLLFFEPLLFFQPAQSHDCRAAIFLSRRNPTIAAPQFFKRLVRSPVCRATIFQEGDPQIALPQFFF
jgi:hypothetical protein